MRTGKSWKHWILALALVAGLSQAQAPAQGQTHMLPTPIPGRPVFSLGTFDLSTLNYVVQEFLLPGDAVSYQAVGVQSNDGRWNVKVDKHAPFTTRLVVIRPEDPAKFNGSVV